MNNPADRDHAHPAPRRHRLRSLPVNSLIPNMLTVISLCAGLTSVRLALNGNFEMAVLAIVLAGVMDGLDGRLARLLKGVTRFGAELDSLADFLSFGVAPVLVLYEWSLSGFGGFAGTGWIAVLAYAVCCALRLARFNTLADQAPQAAWTANFFVGVAAPAAAGLAILPVILTLQIAELEPVLRSPYVLVPYVMGLAALMVSRVPTISLKHIRVQREHVLPILLVVGVGAAALTSYPWITLGLVGLAYAVSIPLTMVRYRVLANRAALRPDGRTEVRPEVRPEVRQEVRIEAVATAPRVPATASAASEPAVPGEAPRPAQLH